MPRNSRYSGVESLNPWSGLAGRLRGEAHQLLRRRIPERPQDRRVEDREDGGVGADAQRQRQQRDGGEHRTAPQRADRVAQIPPDLVQPRRRDGRIGRVPSPVPRRRDAAPPNVAPRPARRRRAPCRQRPSPRTSRVRRSGRARPVSRWSIQRTTDARRCRSVMRPPARWRQRTRLWSIARDAVQAVSGRGPSGGSTSRADCSR